MTENPFLVKGYKGAEFFCDRVSETNALIGNVKNGVDTALISPRKYGKTGLIHHVFGQIEKKRLPFETVYVDVFATLSLADFVKTLAEGILTRFPEKTSIGKAFVQLLKGFRPTFTFDPLTGVPQVLFNYVNAADKEYTLKSLLEFLNSQKKKVVLAIDEFQQIVEYPEKNVEALLRTYTQQLHNIRFIYCGSKRSVMSAIFTDARRPFFSSTGMLSLDKIPRDVYGEFIRTQFKKSGISIEDDALQYILDWTRCHTFYTQSLCNEIFSYGPKKISVDVVRVACYNILDRESNYFLQYRELLTQQQWLMLVGVAREGEVSQVTAKAFLNKYNIGSVTNAKRIVESLVKKDLLLPVLSVEKTSYQVYNVFFYRWLEKEYYGIT